jgi:peptidoglycan/LPS O-acetylase OafA/YrhL
MIARLERHGSVLLVLPESFERGMRFCMCLDPRQISNLLQICDAFTQGIATCTAKWRISLMSSEGQRYRADIDGLRAIAIALVIGFHAFPEWVPGGFIGVDIFFVISGFLITSPIVDGLHSKQFSFAAFYRRRIRRIFPALLLVLAICFVVGWYLLLADEFAALSRHIAAGAGFVSNLQLWSEAGYFDPAAESKPLQHLWSLGIEEQFYIFWPLALYHFYRSGIPLAILFASITGLSFLANVVLIGNDAIAAFYSPVMAGMGALRWRVAGYPFA